MLLVNTRDLHTGSDIIKMLFIVYSKCSDIECYKDCLSAVTSKCSYFYYMLPMRDTNYSCKGVKSEVIYYMYKAATVLYVQKYK